jgi:hypothetical protein
LRTGFPDRNPAVVVARRTPLRFLTTLRAGGAGAALGRGAAFFLTGSPDFFAATAFFDAAFFAADDLTADFFCVVLCADVFLDACREVVFFRVAFFFAAFFFAIDLRPSEPTPQSTRRRD